MKPQPSEFLSHRDPSPDLAAALDRDPACQCVFCLFRRETERRRRIVQEALDWEATQPLPIMKRP